ASEDRLGLLALRAGGAGALLGGGAAGDQVGGVENSEQLSAAYRRAAVHQYVFDEAVHTGLEVYLLIGAQLSRQCGAEHRLLRGHGRHRHSRGCDGRRRRGRARPAAGPEQRGGGGQGQREQGRVGAAHATGSREIDSMPCRCCRAPNTSGRISSVAAVEAIRPPITARPRGAVASLPVSSANAMGIMPATMAAVVMRMGRSRCLAPAIPAAPAASGCPALLRQLSAMVTSRMPLATAIPIAMIAPMNDSRLSVVPVSASAASTPASTAGSDDRTTSASLQDWKLATSRRKITSTANASPTRSPVRVSFMGDTWPTSDTRTPRGGAGALRITASTALAACPRSVPWRLAVSESMRCKS